MEKKPISRLPSQPTQPAQPTPQMPDLSLADVVDHPAYQAAQMIPLANIPLNAVAYGSHMSRGMHNQAMLDAVGVVPGAGMARIVPKVAPRLTRGSLTANSMRASDLANASGFGTSVFDWLK
jgi:hypothetical protein